MPQSQDNFVISVCDELTFTPFAGASLVNEILKGLLYQKCQIPFPYNWLKHLVEKRRKKLSEEESGSRKVNFIHENHYRTVSTAYDHMESVMKGISKEFCDGEVSSVIKEIVLVMGPSPNCAKEVCTIVMPEVAQGHIEKNHMGQLNKHLQRVLRNLFLSQNWMDSIDATVPCTNTYVYIKKHLKTTNRRSLHEIFETCQPPQLSANVKHLKFHVNYSPAVLCTDCCLEEFPQIIEKVEEEVSEVSGALEEQHIVWYRSKGLFKGFKDCFVNKVSVCELW